MTPEQQQAARALADLAERLLSRFDEAEQRVIGEWDEDPRAAERAHAEEIAELRAQIQALRAALGVAEEARPGAG